VKLFLRLGRIIDIIWCPDSGAATGYNPRRTLFPFHCTIDSGFEEKLRRI
jgi:hypothetical protein